MISSKSRVIMISGANRGIGRAVAQCLYDAGFDLSLACRNPADLSGTTVNMAADRIMTARYDAEDRASHTDWTDRTVARFGRIDGLINNAGVLENVDLNDDVFNEAGLDRMWDINVKAPLSMTYLVLPHLRKSGAGRIVNLASLAGKAVYGSGVGYSMTKFAAVALSHATRHAGWDDGVRCTALCPGYVATDMTSDVESTPVENMTSADDLAEMVKMVLSLSNTASIAELVVNCRADVIA